MEPGEPLIFLLTSLIVFKIRTFNPIFLVTQSWDTLRTASRSSSSHQVFNIIFWMIKPNIFSAIAVKDKGASSHSSALRSGSTVGKIDDLDFFIGDEAFAPTAANYSVKVRTILITYLFVHFHSNKKSFSNLAVSDSTRNRGRLGFNGEILGAVHLQISEGRTRRSLLLTGLNNFLANIFFCCCFLYKVVQLMLLDRGVRVYKPIYLDIFRLSLLSTLPRIVSSLRRSCSSHSTSLDST